MISIKELKPVRSYSGIKWKTNKTAKKYLSIDFNNRCAYCDDPDIYNGGYNTYHVEHFAPKDLFEHLQFDYSNLLYSCSYCNIAKSNKWIGSNEKEWVVGNKGFLDPCDDEYYNHLGRSNDGIIVFKTELGEYIFYELKLYLLRHSIIFNINRLNTKRRQLNDKINENKIKGKPTRKLVEAKHYISDVLCDYYDLLHNE